MKYPSLRPATRVVLASFLVLGLTACGGGGDSAQPAPQPGPPSTSANGTITLVAGTLDLSPGAADPDRISGGVATDAGTIVYPSGNTVVRRTAAGVVTPLTATLVGPLGVAVDGGGTVFVTQKGVEQFGPSYQASVVRIDRQGQASTVSTGLTSIWPAAIAAGADGSYYVSAAGTLRRVRPDGTVTNVTAPEVRREIDSIAVDAGGSVYFGENNTVRKIAPGQAEVVLAGSATAGAADGTGAQASFRFGGNKNVLNPLFETSLAVDSAGNVYVADNGNHTIRRISAAGAVTTVAGQAGVAGLETGPLPGKLFAPRGLALAGDKTLYVTSVRALLKIDLP